MPVAYSFGELLVFVFPGLGFDYLIVFQLVCACCFACVYCCESYVNSVVVGLLLF